MRLAAALAALAAASPLAARAAAPPPVSLVVCAPGYPGSTAEAQGAMDGLAAGIARTSGLPAGAVTATYDETERGGVARLRRADLALVPLQFYLQHERDLGLRARLHAVPAGAGAAISWTLVAGKGLVHGPASLAGWTVASIAGFSPGFVRGAALGAWGGLPASARIVQSGAVLSALRQAAAGQHVAVLLDPAQAASVSTLPFASGLEVVARSPPLPASVVATVGGRTPAGWKAIAAGLERMGSDPREAELLAGLHVARFVPVDAGALAAARRAFEAAR